MGQCMVSHENTGLRSEGNWLKAELTYWLAVAKPLSQTGRSLKQDNTGTFFSSVSFSLLASGSDDQHTIVWDPLHHKKLLSMHTGHTANIFSVKVRG